MRYRLLHVMAAFSAGSLLNAQTVQDIADSVAYARGGTQKLKAIQTERFTGSIFTANATGTFTLELKRPNKVRMQFTLADQTTVKGFDGTLGWRIEGASSGKPVKMDQAEQDAFGRSQDIDGLLVGAAEKGTVVEIINKEMLGSSLVWKLKVTPKGADTQYCYVETSGSQLLMKESLSPSQSGKPVTLKQYYRDFRKVKDLTFPFTITSIADDNADSSITLAVEDVILNDAIGDDRFDFNKASVDAPKPKS